MNEIARRSYLNTMGVEVFYLKQPIPLAGKSPAYLFPSEFSQEFESSTEMPSIGEPVDKGRERSKENARSEIAKIRLGLDSQAAAKLEVAETSAKEVPVVTAKQEKTLEPVAAKEGAAHTSALRFKLNYFVLNTTTAIIDEQPYAQSTNPDRDRLDLLRNILTALEVDHAHCSFRAETIAWPLEADMEFDESPDAAAEQMLRGFIAQKHRSHGFKHLLVFAGSLEALLEANKSSLAAEFSMTITSSLSAMLAYPDLKRQVWQQLKPLIPLLAVPCG